MFEFHWPWMALLLILPLLVRLFWRRPAADQFETVEGLQATLLHPSLPHLEAAFQTKQPKMPLRKRLYLGLLSLIWVSLVLPMIRPQ
ncbi:MAG: VWA domain-containing protein, partial [Candidatus Thiodiazotropha taylori]